MRQLIVMLILGLLASQANAQTLRAITKLDELPTRTRDPRQTFSIAGFDAGQMGLVEKTHFEVLSIIDEENCLLSKGEVTIWLADYPTKSLADGDSVCILGAVITGESKQYTDTRGAKRTVRSLKLAPLDDAVRFEKQIAAQIAKEKKEAGLLDSLRKQTAKEAEEAKLYRVFTDVDGKEFKAKFVEYKNQLVHFERKNDKGEVEKHQLPMSKLSKSDVKWIQAELKKRSDAAKEEEREKSKR
jgi:hypothetical protein